MGRFGFVGRTIIENWFGPGVAQLDRMDAGYCMFHGCPRSRDVAVTIQPRWDSVVHLWGVCEHHGRELVELCAGRVHYVSVEPWGVEQLQLPIFDEQ
jgi:hypothetical protein